MRPDILVVCDKEKLQERGCIGAPDMVIEVLSPSTSKRDKTIKLELYKKYGVKEYWIVDIAYKEITVYSFVENRMDMYSLYENEEEKVSVGIFGGELVIVLKDIFGEFV